MRKLKNALILLLALGVIVLMARLPMIAGNYIDRSASNQIQYLDSNALYLEITEPSLWAKLAVLSQADTVTQVSPDDAAMQISEVEACAASAIVPYQEAGLIPYEFDLSHCSIDCQPYFEYSAYHPTLTNIIWEVLISPYAFSEDLLYLIIDDQTGAILSINAQFPSGFLYDSGSPEMLLDLFPQIYFHELGQQFDSIDLESALMQNEEVALPYEEDLESYVTYSWGDIEYGEITIRFHVTPMGFYTVFPPL